MKIVFDEWEEKDIYNLLQIVLAAKFLSSRREMMGAPLVDEIIGQVIAYDFKEPLYQRLVSGMRTADLGPREIKRIRDSLRMGEPTWDEAMLRQFIRQMAYPYRIGEEVVDTLIRVARSTARVSRP